MTYIVPLDEIIFTLHTLADCEQLRKLPTFSAQELDQSALHALLQPAAQIAERSVGPSNRVGDLNAARLVDGRVVVSNEIIQALRDIFEGGWNGVSMPTAVGGFGLPECINTAVIEMWNSGNMALALNPTLTVGAALALLAHGSEEQIDRYVPNLVSGTWAGTMNLTEPGAGSDLSRITTQAMRRGDHYRLRGQKIFITWGDHDVTENIIHLVLARTPDAPAGTRGISLFIVPKFLVNADGSLGARNDVHCIAIEHKLGLHTSPTCVMSYGETEGAIGYLVGAENHGLAYLFTMMNEARIKIGMEGLGVAESAYQQALHYARERVQGNDANGKPVPIIHHSDVQRMLLTQRALIQAMRALVYVESITGDIARHADDAETRAIAQRRVDLTVPIIKAWLTELGQEVASLGMQIHGGMGYIEETGAAQFLRDVRVAAIYEGSNGIQALDLLGRKLLRDRGKAMHEWLLAMTESGAELLRDQPALRNEIERFAAARAQLAQSTEFLLQRAASDLNGAQAGAHDFLMQCGYVYGAWQSLRILALQQSDTRAAAQSRKVAARFYLDRILPRAAQHAQALRGATDYWSEDNSLQFE